jgi:hypothetical protein
VNVNHLPLNPTSLLLLLLLLVVESVLPLNMPVASLLAKA